MASFIFSGSIIILILSIMMFITGLVKKIKLMWIVGLIAGIISLIITLWFIFFLVSGPM